jgi:hypothetical protein
MCCLGKKTYLLNEKVTAFERWFYCQEKTADRKRRTVETPTLGRMLGDESGKRCRRRLWEICSGEQVINDPCFR